MFELLRNSVVLLLSVWLVTVFPPCQADTGEWHAPFGSDTSTDISWPGMLGFPPLEKPTRLPASQVAMGGNYSDGLMLGNQTVAGSLSTSGGADLNGTIVNGSLSVGGRAALNRIVLEGHLNSGGHLQLSESSIGGNVNTGGRAEIVETNIKGSLNAGSGLRLVESEVEGDVRTRGRPEIISSRIEGVLYSAASELALDAAVVNSICMNVPSGIAGSGAMSGNRNVFVGNGMIVGRNNIVGNQIVSSGGGSVAHVGPGSVMSINGYRISATLETTTLIIPDGTVYVNTQKVYGGGSPQYSDYRADHPEAPRVQGPGWEVEVASADAPLQVVRLRGQSMVLNEVRFEGGHGKLIVEKGSRFNGAIIGGVIERL